jgi:hypothetical protein
MWTRWVLAVARPKLLAPGRKIPSLTAVEPEGINPSAVTVLLLTTLSRPLIDPFPLRVIGMV